MSSVHSGLFWPADSPVHRMPAHCKLVALVGFVCVVVATPSVALPAFGAYAALWGVVAAASGVPARVLARRCVIELPFVVLAVVMVATGGPPYVVGHLSVAGLWAAWSVLAKGTLGVAASVLLAATTAPRDILAGMARLRAPTLIVHIGAHMLRYLEVTLAQWHAMRRAASSRGAPPTTARSVTLFGCCVGALFLRCYERGERVHLAMLSRAATGPVTLSGRGASARTWCGALAIPLVGAGVTITAHVMY